MIVFFINIYKIIIYHLSPCPFWLINSYYVVLDSLIANMYKRFSSESLKLAIAIDQLFKLNFENSMAFIT